MIYHPVTPFTAPLQLEYCWFQDYQVLLVRTRENLTSFCVFVLATSGSRLSGPFSSTVRDNPAATTVVLVLVQQSVKHGSSASIWQSAFSRGSPTTVRTVTVTQEIPIADVDDHSLFWLRSYSTVGHDEVSTKHRPC